MRTKLEDVNDYGKVILSNEELAKTVKRNSAVVCLAVGVAAFAVIGLSASPYFETKPPVLDTETGQIFVSYSHLLSERTLEERLDVAKWTYIGLRRRTGYAEIDGEALRQWGPQVTQNGLAAITELGARWEAPDTVVPGFRRTIQIIDVTPDKVNPYAFTVEAIESDGKRDDERSIQSYRVRLTMFFTDPAIHGVSKLDAVALHEERAVK